MSLKRLLNPTDLEPVHELYTHHRPETGWDEFGAPIEAIPVLQDQSWSSYAADLLGADDLHGLFDNLPDGNGFSEGPLCYAQEQIEQWAAENLSAQTTSFIPISSDTEEQICYGMVYRAAVRLKGNMLDLEVKLGNIVEASHRMSIMKSDEQFLVVFFDGTEMGQLNAQLEKAFDSIFQQQQHLDFEVFAPIKQIRETIGKSAKEKDAIVRVNINIYGNRDCAQQVGQQLSKHRIYLQRPDEVRAGLVYENPHELKLKLPNVQLLYNDCEAITTTNEEVRTVSEKAEAFKKTISNVYSSLTRGQKLIGLEGDGRLKTQLLPHQKGALDFMVQRENGPIPEEFCLWKPSEIDGQPCYRHVVTNLISRLPQIETGGGILADEMGMGKTLCILALISRTLDAAHDWSTMPVPIVPEAAIHRKEKLRTRATLVVASSDLMINEWVQEIERHFHDQVSGALKTIKYHGQYRETDAAKLCDADLVITTYHTLASDFGKKKIPLDNICWHRLVLDEAHIIRRQSTGLYRTVAKLDARSRWCLTGTPIQNRLEDIGSLFAFLKVRPMQNLSEFRKSIAIPFEQGGRIRTIAIERFTLLLDALCLRRTKDLLHLPDQHNRVRMIDFSADERLQYDRTSKMMFRAVRNQVGGFDHKGMLGMFQVQLQLRILCNHGTFQKPFSWNRRKIHLLDEREDMGSALGRDGEITCTNCKETMPLFSAGQMYRRYTEHCRHVLCSECLEESSGNQSNNSSDCPLCSSLWGSASATHTQSQRSKQHGDTDHYFKPGGRSSKVEALVEDVQQDLLSTKSIIFTCWTRTLDLIESSLQYASIKYLRIDGDCPTSRREKILDDFAKNPEFRVLIMTTGTGAVGLNLATANRVFIVEPQWNPSVENQAIARALRLGQEQSVQVTRYVVNKTIEQEMRTLQDRKLEIAGIAWE